MRRTVQRVFDVEGFSEAEVLPRAKVLDMDEYGLLRQRGDSAQMTPQGSTASMD